ncbi:hypothetical protein ABFS83_10G107100 [Erythranthe nasuta]
MVLRIFGDIDFIVLSSISKQYLCIIGVSSHMISFALNNNSACGLYCLMIHVELSCTIIGSLNLECAVLPPGSRSNAIPLEATFITISPFERISANKVFHMKVFLVPPCP